MLYIVEAVFKVLYSAVEYILRSSLPAVTMIMTGDIDSGSFQAPHMTPHDALHNPTSSVLL